MFTLIVLIALIGISAVIVWFALSKLFTRIGQLSDKATKHFKENLEEKNE